MEHRQDLCTGSSAGHAQDCLFLRGGETITLFIHPGKTLSGNEEQRDQVWRVAERVSTGCCQPNSIPQHGTCGVVTAVGREHQCSSHLHVTPSLLPLKRPGSSIGPGHKSHRCEPGRSRAMSWGTGQHLPPGLSKATLQKSGKPQAPLSCASGSPLLCWLPVVGSPHGISLCCIYG